jgi:hypothetical protein
VSIRHLLRTHLPRMALLAAMFVCIGLSPASSRVWKATPDKIAREYATINDTRADGELVLLMWFVPAMVRPDATGAAPLTAMLQKYVVLMAVHGQLDKATGSISFEDVNTLEARDQNEKPLALLARNDLPPTATAVLAAVETLFRQSLGAMGKGMKMFLFEAGTVDSCKKGELSVPFAGETYTWDTPIPGCAQK